MYVSSFTIATTTIREKFMSDKVIREAVSRLILELDEHLPKAKEIPLTLDFQVLIERFLKVQLQLRGLLPFETKE